ncbi:MAG TPA: peptidase U32 family protein, partial [bacterium]|nr:peptidase U32 family protein [bacterium]
MAELLAPAGNPEKLIWADIYGADAVYFGVTKFSLRSFAGNFTIDEASAGLEYLHKKGKRGFVTLNIYPYSGEYKDLITTARELEECKADALIVSDLGVINELKKAGIRIPIHISTQANTLSYQTVNAYHDLGAKRVNLARELSFEKISEISKKREKGVEIEVFIHGAVCFSFSGRCAISDWLTGRKANRGECTHPCRWNY